MPEYPPLICGIDPGLSGGIALLDGRSKLTRDVPIGTYKMPATEAEVMVLMEEFAPHIRMAFLEAVHSFPGQGIASAFTFGKGYGFLRGVMVALKVPFVDVSPMKWKKALGLHFTADDSKKDKKNGSKQLAQQWWPDVKVTHGTAECLLIAEYGRRQQ